VRHEHDHDDYEHEMGLYSDLTGHDLSFGRTDKASSRLWDYNERLV
jgi:hypothetical protein